MSNYLSVEKRKQIFQRRFSLIVYFINRRYINDLIMPEIEADEIKTFVQNKTNIKWVYIALDRASRLVIHSHIGSRDANDAEIFLSGLSDKLSEVSKVSTDCLISYIAAVQRTRTWNDRYSTESIDLIRARILSKCQHMTNRIESYNGNVRQHVAKLGRKTRCFAKKDESLRQHLSLFFFYYNFIKIHTAVKTAPAVAAGILKKPFTFDDIIEYDLMFTGRTKNLDHHSIYGRVERGASKYSLTPKERALFLNEIQGIGDIKFYEVNRVVNIERAILKDSIIKADYKNLNFI